MLYEGLGWEREGCEDSSVLEEREGARESMSTDAGLREQHMSNMRQ